VLPLASLLFANGKVLNEKVDIRELRLHEATSPQLALAPLVGHAAGAFPGGSNALYFFGTADEARPLAGRRLYLSHDDGRSVELVCTSAESGFASSSPAPRMWPLSFDRAPRPFTRNDFDEDAPTVTVFGNLVDASQGKTEREAVLGNGDRGQVFQTFVLPKSPLTYFIDSEGTPPHAPELEVRVSGRLWTRVDALFGRGPKDEVYIVREDAEGRSYVQFGDGETGARLPTGLKNVTAIFRSGIGARGPVKPGSTPTAPERPAGFDKVSIAGIVSGGADPEDIECAREAAPGKVQSLGRMVSLRDHETETLALPGVSHASARWDLHAGVPALLLRVLLDAGREAEFEAVRAAIAHAQRCRGPNRHPLVVQQAFLRHVFLDLAYARDPVLRADEVEAAVRAELGLAGDEASRRSGLFGLRARRLGGREYASRIEARVQNVAGVLWCRVVALGRFGGGVRDPATLVLPTAPRGRVATLPCAAHELLQLDARHLTLLEAAEPTAGPCA
jgi:predicted phage baseplate assembly protein